MARSVARVAKSQGTTTARWTLLAATFTAVVAVLLCSVVVIVMAWRDAEITSGRGTSQRTSAALPVSGELQSGLRSLPLRSTGDPVGASFPDGLSDEAAVTEKLVEVAEPLGLGAHVLWLSGLELRDDGSSFPVTYDEHGRSLPLYPYEYMEIDSTVAATLDVEAVNTDTDAVLDLTALLTAAAAQEWEYPSPFRSGAAVAYSVLRHALRGAESCELQLQLAFVVSMGQNVSDANLSTEVEKARDLCPGEPTPLWLRSQVRARNALQESLFGYRFDATRPELMAGAVEDLETLREESGDNPLGSAGLADLLLDRADASEDRGLRPFQTRTWRRQALDLYAEARTKSADPGLLAGHARALTDLGRFDEAGEVLKSVPDDLSALRGFVTMAVRNDQSRGDFSRVLETLKSTSVLFPNTLELVTGDPDFGRLPGFGRLTAAPSTVLDATWAEGGGASTLDVSFIPQHRTNWSADGFCLEVDAINALVLEGRADETDDWTSEAFTTPEDPISGPCLENGFSAQRLATDSFDDRQDLLRWARRLTDAAEVVAVWQDEEPSDYAASQRAGELAYLEGEYASASEHFRTGLDLWYSSAESESSPSNYVFTDLDLIPPQAVLNLQLAAALEGAGEQGAARESLVTQIDELDANVSEMEANEVGAARFYALSQLGSLEVEAEKFDEAVERLRDAVSTANDLTRQQDSGGFELSRNHEGDADFSPLRGSQENNLALALARSGDSTEAKAAAAAALTRDPASPIFLDTLAFTHQLAGNSKLAVDAYRAALKADSTSYVSANNLAVLLANEGELGKARELLREALAVAPDYAKAWHNLGVVNAQMRRPFIETQGSFAIAGRLSSSLRGGDSGLLVDSTIYNSGLDVSKALSPTWSYARTAHSSNNGFVWSMVLLLALRLAWALGLDRVVEAVATRTIAPRTDTPGRRVRVWRQAPSFLALAVSGVVLALPAMQWATGWTAKLLAFVAIFGIVIAPICARWLLASPHSSRQVGWLPAIGVGGAAALVGVSLAPFPGVDDDSALRRRVAWAAAVTVAALTILFAALAFASAVPLARFLAMAGAALLASILLPIHPFDGKRLQGRFLGIAVTAALGLATAAFTAGWI